VRDINIRPAERRPRPMDLSGVDQRCTSGVPAVPHDGIPAVPHDGVTDITVRCDTVGFNLVFRAVEKCASDLSAVLTRIDGSIRHLRTLKPDRTRRRREASRP